MQALLDAIAAAPLPTEACRIFHGRGGLHPGCEGWTLDAYPPVWVFTSFEPADDALLAAVHQALQARWATLAPGAALHWVYQCRHPQQRETRTMAGQVPEPHVVQEDGARYLVHVLRGQNHGLFLDMAEGRRWVQRHAAQHLGAAEGHAQVAHLDGERRVEIDGGGGHQLAVRSRRGNESLIESQPNFAGDARQATSSPSSTFQ